MTDAQRYDLDPYPRSRSQGPERPSGSRPSVSVRG